MPITTEPGQRIMREFRRDAMEVDRNTPIEILHYAARLYLIVAESYFADAKHTQLNIRRQKDLEQEAGKNQFNTAKGLVLDVLEYRDNRRINSNDWKI